MLILRDLVGMLILIALWLTVIIICLATIYLTVTIGISLWSEYVIKIKLKTALMKKEIEKWNSK